MIRRAAGSEVHRAHHVGWLLAGGCDWPRAQISPVAPRSLFKFSNPATIGEYTLKKHYDKRGDTHSLADTFSGLCRVVT